MKNWNLKKLILDHPVRDTPQLPKASSRVKFYYDADSSWASWVELNGERIDVSCQDSEVMLRILNYKLNLGLQIEYENINEKREK